jgi:hypothetical protein
LNEINTFKNEVVHFFNIDSINSSIYIYIEIEGKKIQSENTKENYYKIILKDVGTKSEKKELNCKLFDNIELKILIRIIKKFGIRKSSIFENKIIEEEKPGKKRGNTQFAPSLFSQNGISKKEKIKIFSGEFINKQIFNNNAIQGKLKMPSLSKKKNDEKSNENKIEDIKDNFNDNNCNNNDNN